ncbi:MAG: hypothetical protein OEW79_13255 [Betaproteobacteria bacterium]|nr:hypothetical protein [Betaproteobacteria bacterium]MDH5343784.1 hypothetical protein [Betaproteobacteria bacterium]
MSPQRLHAAYTGIAETTSADSPPVLLWGSASAHVCLGQSQSAACELAPDIDVPVVQRPLGGGTVWIDENQFVYAFIVPLHLAPQRPADWSAWALPPAMATFRRFGLGVEQRAGDLWLRGRKIAGSGAATIGGGAVFASSFLMRFPRQRFAGCIAGSPGFRAWLEAGLAATLTDWSEHAPVCVDAELRSAFCDDVSRTMGWQLAHSVLSAGESSAIDAVDPDEHDDDCGSRRRAHRDGIKLNADSHLVERTENGLCIRELVVHGTVSRRAVSTV